MNFKEWWALKWYDKPTKLFTHKCTLKEWWNMKWYDKLLATVCHRCTVYEQDLTKENKGKVAGETIYGTGMTYGEYVKQQNRIHKWFKYTFMYPLLKLFKKVLGKYLVKEIPDEPWNYNLKIFDIAWQNALIDWCDVFITTNQEKSTSDIKVTIQRLKQENIKYLNLMKDIMVTGILNDTAYREFFNCLMLNIALEMNKNHPKAARHIFYNSKQINDIFYFAIAKNKTLQKVYGSGIPKSELKSKHKPEQ